MATRSNSNNNMKIKSQQTRLHFLLMQIVMLCTPLSVMAEDLIFNNSFEGDLESIQGVASGITSSGLVLKLTVGVDTELLQVDNNGVFRFSSLLEIDTAWLVEINVMPNNPVQQNCQLVNNSGIISSGGVNNLLVSCDEAVSKWDEMNWDTASWN